MWQFALAIGLILALTLTVGAIREPNEVPASTAAKTYAFRLKPGDDLKKELLAFVKREKIQAGVMVTCVGSLTKVTLRFANQKEAKTRNGHFEILSLVGMVDAAGGHLHLCVGDGDGDTFGGHLMDGCIVYTTAEIAMTELTDVTFDRQMDMISGYKELVVLPRK